jgi:molybdopterin converting factor small subunit
MQIELRLFATLRRFLPANSNGSKAVMDVPEGTQLQQLIEQLGIPPQLAQLVMVDGIQEPNRARLLAEGNVISIFPPVAGGCFPH